MYGNIFYEGDIMQVQGNASLEKKLFLLRALRHPRKLGAIAPSSRYLGALMARHVIVDDNTPLIELGGGTGSLTRALINSGVSPEQIYVIELDSELAEYLKKSLPGVNVIQGDATSLSKILPTHIIGNIPRIVSGIPMMNIPEPIQRKIVDSCFEIMSPGGALLQYTYSPRSSLNAKAFQLKKKRLGTVFRNLPPASVWQYTKV
jgi:phosphatidylethanolamine/phosphatidyl-N-methylethanolamine N-methyltransferase